jgi:adenylosuccinate synthase
VRINGVTSLVLTKLDVLSGRETLEVATSYRLQGEERAYPPTDVERLVRCEPVYETVPGWEEPIGKVRRYADLPKTAREYIERIEDGARTSIRTVSVGSGRNQVITVPSRVSR